MGLVDGGGVATLGYWQAIVPQSGVNLCSNPSFEKDASGWTATNATFTRTPGAGLFGAYGGRMLASATNGKAGTTLASVTSGTLGTGSVYVRSTSALVQIKVTIGASSSVQFHPGDGLFHRIETPLTAPSTTTPVVEIIDTRTSGWDNVDVDGVQFETGTLVATTYIDGDQDGCTWNGAPHASTSTRDGRDGRGGQVVSLDSVGLRITGWKGTGAPPVDVATQTLALGDGELYQRSTAKSRVLTLQGLIIGDTTGLPSWHAQRRTIIDLFRPDSRSNRGPITLRYAGPTVPKRIATYYQSGLEMDSLDAADEKPEIKMLAPDPNWQGEWEAAQAVVVNTTITGVGLLALRNSSHVWSNVGGGSVAGVGDQIFAADALLDGRVVVGGFLTDMGGVSAADYLAVWDGTTWAALGGATPNSWVQCLCLAPNGDLYVGGFFANLAGNANADSIAVWQAATNTWAALGTGTTSGYVTSIVVDPATNFVYAVGTFTTMGGVTTTAGAAVWNGSAWTSIGTGFPTGWGTALPCLAIGPDGFVYCSVKAGVYRWTGTTWTLMGAANADNLVYQIKTMRGSLYACGSFTTIGGVACNRIARYNGTTWEPLGAGASAGLITTMTIDDSGLILVGGQGWGTIGTIQPLDNLAAWNGSTWRTFEANPPDTGTHANDLYSVFSLRNGTLVLSWHSSAGTFGTSLVVSPITVVTNDGSANAYPIVTFEGGGTLWSLENLTTGQRITFAGKGSQAGEISVLDLRPGHKTFKSQIRDLMNNLLPDSDLSTFALAPGANNITCYATGGTATMRWLPKYWSAD